jgi:uncharacterized membrane protein
MSKECDTLTVVEEPVEDIKVTAVDITSPSDKTVYPGGSFSFEITVHNYGNVAGDVAVKITCDGTEVSGSPVTITDVPAGGDKSETFGLTAPATTGVFDICGEEL